MLLPIELQSPCTFLYNPECQRAWRRDGDSNPEGQWPVVFKTTGLPIILSLRKRRGLDLNQRVTPVKWFCRPSPSTARPPRHNWQRRQDSNLWWFFHIGLANRRLKPLGHSSIWLGQVSNLHGITHQILSLARIPIPPPSLILVPRARLERARVISAGFEAAAYTSSATWAYFLLAFHSGIGSLITCSPP